MKRRDLLKTVGVTAVAGTAGLSSVASADASEVDPTTMREQLADNEDLLRELSEDGVLDRADPEQFALDAHAVPGASEEGASLTTAKRFDGSETTPSYVVNHETEDGFVTVRVRPEIDFATATHRTDDGEVTVYGAQVPGEDGDVGVQCHGGCDNECLIERCDGCPGEDCDTCCWCEPTCTPGCFC